MRLLARARTQMISIKKKCIARYAIGVASKRAVANNG
jgi:hypothetical protein